MPGICGIIDLHGEPASPAWAAMVRPLVPHPWFVVEASEQVPGIRLAAVSLDRTGRKPHLAADRAASLVCVVDGEFYNAAELARGLPSSLRVTSGEQPPSDAALLLAGWQHSGRDFLRQINGSFSALLWNSATRVATLVTDRFGNRPLYYAAVRDRLLVSSRLKSLTADPGLARDIDPRGLAQFFTFGHYLGTDTSLAGVKVLPAAACWTWQADTGTCRRDSYYSWAEAYEQSCSNEADWIARVGDAFCRSVERQTADTPNLGLSLSGGLDARTILAAIDTQATPLKTVCLGIAGSLDHRCAQRLADLAGCRNHSHILDTQFLSDYRPHLQQMVELTDGQYLSQCIVMPTLPLYRDLGIEVLLRGHAGELMHMYKAYNYSLDEEALRIGGGDLQTWLHKRLSAYMLDGVVEPIFAGDLWGDLHRLASESLAADVAATTMIQPPVQRIWQLFVTQRLRRETVLSLNKFRAVTETRLPLLDNELTPLLLAAPPSLKLGENIQTGLLKRLRPEFLGVVNANTGTRVGAGAWMRKMSSLKLRALGKLGLPGYQPYERLGLWLKRELKQLVRDVLLDPQTLDRGLYRADGIRAVVENHQTGRGNHSYLIMALMIFELGQRYLQAPPPSQTGEPLHTSVKLLGAAQ